VTALCDSHVGEAHPPRCGACDSLANEYAALGITDSPPQVVTSQARWIHEQPGQTETVEELIRRAHRELDLTGLKMSPSKVSRLIRQRVRLSGNESACRMVSAYLASTSAHAAFCLTYTDPTGETAVRNVLAGEPMTPQRDRALKAASPNERKPKAGFWAAAQYSANESAKTVPIKLEN
jgi:hypothetical protein